MNTGANNSTAFSAFADDDIAVVRVAGPGICRESGRFESILLQVEDLGYGTLVIDLADCARMDSTFAGTFLRLASRAAKRPPGAKPFRVVLAGARNQVTELLDTLCLSDVFEMVQIPNLENLTDLEIRAQDPSREQVMAISLDGHQRLAELNPANARRFETLIPILRSELAKVREPRS